MEIFDHRINFVFLITLIVIAIGIGILIRPKEQKIISPIPEEELMVTVIPSPTITPTPKPTKRWEGKVSHYSASGCLGCSATLTMANGEKLDDNKMTIAFNWLPMNTKVKITNLDNGKSVVAVVTDTGGFNKYHRIADLTPAVAVALGTRTDVTNVRIEAL